MQVPTIPQLTTGYYLIRVKHRGVAKMLDQFSTNEFTLAEWMFVGASVDGNVDVVEMVFHNRVVRRDSKMLVDLPAAMIR